MGLLDAASSLVSSVATRAQAAVETVKEKVVAVEQKIEAKAAAVEARVTKATAELSGKVSSFAQDLPTRSLTAAVIAPRDELKNIAPAVDQSPGKAAVEIQSKLARATPFDNDDIARETSASMTDEQLQRMAGDPQGKAALLSMKAAIDSSWGSLSAGDKLEKSRIDKALASPIGDTPKIDPNTNLPESLQPGKSLDDAAHIPFKNEGGGLVRSYKTGDNITKMPDGELEATPEDQAKTKADQAALVSKMQAALPGQQVDNPPSLDQAKKYFQKVAGKGTPAEVEVVKQELGSYLKNFYVHAGQGVDWGAGKNLANKLEDSLAGQPRLKDGRTVVDCEGFAALTERLLGDIKEPGGKKMFELMQGATPHHAIVGVFRRGDPFQQPFMVSNSNVTSIPQDTLDIGKKLNSRPNQSESTQKFLLKQLVYDEVNGGHGNKHVDRPSLETGRAFDSRTPFVTGG